VEFEKNPKKRGAGKTVLIVDDNAVIRKLIAEAFMSDGFQTCVGAENGKHALEPATQLKPDLVTLDLSMPIMNGLLAASEMRKILPSAPIILFSMYGDTLSKTDVSGAGISLVLSKGTPLSRLLDKVHELFCQ
jgi:two-component system, chemotaxis family, chemotaxis protein CheY